MGKLLKGLDFTITAIGNLALFGLIFVAFLQVFFRYVLNNAQPWPEEICRFTFIVLAYTGMIMMMRKNGHLRVDIAITLVSDSVKKILNIITYLCSIFYCFLASYLTFQMLLAVKDMEQMASTVDIAIYLTWIPIPVGLALTGLYAILNLYSYLIQSVPQKQTKGK